jgi:hypothetical protein
MALSKNDGCQQARKWKRRSELQSYTTQKRRILSCKSDSFLFFFSPTTSPSFHQFNYALNITQLLPDSPHSLLKLLPANTPLPSHPAPPSPSPHTSSPTKVVTTAHPLPSSTRRYYIPLNSATASLAAGAIPGSSKAYSIVDRKCYRTVPHHHHRESSFADLHDPCISRR